MACQSTQDRQAWNETQIHRGGIATDFPMGPQRTAGARGIRQADSSSQGAHLLSGWALRVRASYFCEFVPGYDALRRTASMLREAGSGKTRDSGSKSGATAWCGKRAYIGGRWRAQRLHQHRDDLRRPFAFPPT